MTTLTNKPLNQVTEADLQALVANGVQEAKTLDYKRALPGQAPSERKEFLADVSSFANASGGDLIFGIDESAGVPVNLCGLGPVDPDKEILRLESMILNGLEPRIPGIQTRPIPLASNGHVIVMRVPRSWALPHMLKEAGRFYSRTSRGKYPLDVQEIRSLFVLSETATERVRRFRIERVSNLVAGEAPVVLEPEPKTVLQLIPLQAFEPARQVEVSIALSMDSKYLRPLGASGNRTEFNFDGVVTFESNRETGRCWNYLQLFRNGIIETVDASTISARGKKIPGASFDWKILQAVPVYLNVLERLSAGLPIVVALTLVGVKGFKLAAQSHPDGVREIDRDVLPISEIIIETYATTAGALKPLLDRVWNAAGYGGNLNLNQDGTWIGEPQPIFT